MDTLIANRAYSSSSKAISRRSRRLQDDSVNDAARARDTKYRKKLASNKALKKANGGSAFSYANRNKYLTARITHHLSRGRSIADIVIRENAPVSLVQKLVKQMEVAK